MKNIQEIIMKSEEDNKKNAKSESKTSRQTYFTVDVCDTWTRRQATHIILKILRNKYNLNWFRFSMSYHKFSNLRQTFQGDLTSKLMKGISSKDLEDLECNCNIGTKIDGRCIYNYTCRNSILVYKAIYRDCQCFYISNTQQYLKTRMN